MVFESVFANLLNTYLSSFIDDVSASQLKLGALQGNIALRNLAVKPNAFDALRLPIHIVHGHVGSLVLKIPWMSLYTSPVIIELKDIFVVCIPNVENNYDEEFEENRIQAEKQIQLQNIDEAIKKAALKSASPQSSDDPKADDFVTKTVAQIVKNLEISIENVHVVYEDKFSYPKVPFSVGLTLSKLLFKTEPRLQTTAKFTSSKPENCIFKQVKLEYLSAYWNCSPNEFISESDESIRDDLLRDSIPGQNKIVTYLNYILEPNVFSANTVINRKPEVDRFSMPLLDLDMVLDQLSLCFNRAQFESLLMFLDSINRMKVANMFRKWRPKQSIMENRKVWWIFAITSVLERDIRRRNKEWSWAYIRNHMKNVRQYKEAYKIKLLKTKFTKETEKEIAELEKKLDVFNIVLCRNEAEKEVNEERKKQEKNNPPKKEQKGWFSGWWGGESVEQKEKTIVNQFKNEMTPEEKLKFYKAIGYEESSGPTEFPPDFVAHLINLHLKSIKFIVVDVTKEQRILQFSLDGMKTEVHNRPASNGLLLKTTFKALMIYGCKGVVMADEQMEREPLLKLTVELNPLSKKFDCGLDLKMKSIKMIFDALTVNTLLEIVSPPKDVSFDELQSLATIKMNEYREMSATGLEYAIEQHKQLSVNIDIEPSFIIVPENGNIRNCVNVLLLCLGRAKIISHLIDKNEVKNIRNMSQSESLISQYREKAYERYALSVEQIQLLLSNFNNWKDDIVASQSDVSTSSPLNDRRLIEPIAINLTLMRAIVSDDPELPNLKVVCDIPSLYVKASDVQIIELISLATSIPTSNPKSDFLDVDVVKYESTSITRAKQASDALKAVELQAEAVKNISETQLTEIQIKFSIGALVIDLKALERDVIKDVLKMKVLKVGASVEKKTFNLIAAFHLNEIKVQVFNELHYSENPYMLMETSQDSHLLEIKYEFCAQNSPLFKDTIQEVDIKISEISFSVSRPVITSLLVWSQGIVDRLPKSEPRPEIIPERKTSISLRTRASSFASLNTIGLKPKKIKSKKEESEQIEISNFAAFFEIQCFSFHIDSICSVAFKGFNFDLKLTASEKVILCASWEHFEIANKISKIVLYEYIIQSESEKVLELGVVMYPKRDVEEKRSPVDIMVKVNFGRLKVVFLNLFVSELLSFLSVFEAAKAKAIDASSAAATYAKQSAANAVDSAIKIGLNLVLEAPNIIIPRNWDSKQYLLIDLGKVIITNDLKSTQKLILDTINCELMSTRIAVITDDSLQSFDNILAPISFSVKITRNLTFDTNKSQPELNLSATLHDIQLSIAQCDLKLAMQILNENIAGGASVQTSREPAQAVESVNEVNEPTVSREVAPSANLQSSVIVEEAVVHVDAVQETLQEPVYVRFNFDFLLPRITLVLFDGNSKGDDTKLCELLLTELECYGVIRTNETIHAGLSLSNVVVSDVRKKRKDTGIRKIVSTKHNIPSQSEKSGKMIAISFTQQTDAYIDVNMSGFTIVLALDYLLHVSKVITTGLATEPVESISKTESISTTEERPHTETPEVVAPAKQTNKLIVLDCRMSRTDIILIECIDRTDCPAVILKNVVEVGLKQQDERLHFNGKISNIQLGITNFEKYMKNNDDIEAYILQPTELNVVAAINGPTQHLDVMFSEINIHISPNTVQLLLSIISSLGTTEKDAKDDQSDERQEIDITTFFTPQKITDTEKYWFLKPVVSPAIEATEENLTSPSSPTEPTLNNSPFLVVQQVVLTVKQVCVVIESGGIDSQPMIKLQSEISGNFDNWNKLNLTISCFMDYYNEKLYVWEPMIEPVEKCTIWSFDLMLDIVDNGDSTSAFNVMVESKDRLELTLSKASFAVLMSCSDAFANAVKQSESLAQEHAIVVTNELGIDLFMFMAAANFKCTSQELQPKKENETVCVMIPSGKVGSFQATSTEMHTLDSDSDINFRLIAGHQQIDRTISLKTKDKRCFNFPVVSYPGKEWKYLIDMSQRDSNNKNIVFHSTVEITNKFHKTLELYYVEESEPKLLSEIKNQQKLFIPLPVVYHPSQRIFVKPSNDYCTPLTPISWESKDCTQKYVNIKCESKKGLADFYIRVKKSVEDLLFEESQLWNPESFCFKFELLPSFKLRNLLPVSVKYSIEGINKEWSLSPGQENDVSYVDLKSTSMKIKVENYLNKNWISIKTLPSKWTNEDQVDVWTYNAASEEGVTMDLAMNYSTADESGIRVASIFCPFWMINKTSITVSYKIGESVIKHEKDLTVPALVCFKQKTLFSKKKLALSFDDSKWSDEFSIDAVGNKGTVVAKGKGKSKMSYCASIDIELCSFSLTKVVTVSPFYSIHNKTFLDLQVSDDNDEWVTVNSKESKALWPKNTKDNKLYFRLSIYSVSSNPVSLEDTNSVLLLVGDQLINVHVEISDSGVSILAYNYFEGSAAVRIFNATNDLSIDYGQHCLSRRNRIAPMKCAYFTWHEPMLRRVLVWSSPECGEMFLELDKDAIGEASSNLFWVTFLDGKQRILLITRDFEMAKNALHAGELAKPLYNAVISMRGIGISLVNDDKHQELLYIGIYSSGVVWEVAKNKTKKFKALSVKQNDTIEAAYQKELLRRRVTNDLVITDTADRPSILNLTNSLKVDLTDLKNPAMIDPIKGKLRRSSSLGLWCSVGVSPHVFQFHLKINRIQIDNQTDDCFFRIIMCPVTPPKSLSQDRAPKAFIEVSSLIQRQAYMQRFKFLSVLIQEFLIQVDGDVLMALADFFAISKGKKDLNYEKMIQDDLKLAFSPETTMSESDVALSKKNYYDLIHFSPIKVHVSFAMGNAASFEILGMFDFLIKSAGVTLTEFKDVLFKIDFFEKKNVLLSQDELTSSATSHYVRQILKQFYVIVLGLDVIGNPVGLFLGLKQGVGDFFYEPVVGIIEGPEEFAEGLAIGFKSLFSSTVGGAAGALGRITGTVSQGLASLTMDEEDKRRRRENLNRNQTISQSGKNLAKGFFSGITGLVTKPMQGAKTEGFGGLIKGVGRGVVGVVAQPATGVIDFASGSLNALQRAVDVNAEAKRQRPARHIQKDGVIRPYNLYEAEGRSLLHDLSKGEYSETDTYVAHSVVIEGTLLITDKNILYLRKTCMFKNIEVEWCEPFVNVANVEIVNNTNIKITLKEQKKKMGGLVTGRVDRIVACQSPDIASWLLEIIAKQRK